jgi:ATP-dependent DNA ligase
MNVLFFDGKEAAIINRSGRIRQGLPCIDDAAVTLKAAGVTQAVIPAELHAAETEGRTRVFHVLKALADPKLTAGLHLAAFDLLELSGEPFRAASYKETHAKLAALFSGAKLCGAVEGRACSAKKEIAALYSEWVEEGGAEGLVVRTDLPLVYKVKPRHTLDAVIIGYSENSGDKKGQIRSLLLAMMPFDGQYQIIGKAGNGLADEAKKELLEKLAPLTCNSNYIETDSNNVAFHLIRPEVVIELQINDVLFDNSSGSVDNTVLFFENGAYVRKGMVPGISVVFPIFVRFRDDKRAVYEDIRLDQINDFAYIAPQDVSLSGAAAPSELLTRTVYKKESGAKLMVQKFLVWKTNKSADGYPAFVFHYTNFSSDRKEPLQRELMVSDDEAQIMELFGASVEKNVKSGWAQV